MQSLQGAMRTAAFVLGVLLLLVATLDAVPSPRDILKNSITSPDKCEQFLRTELGLHVKLPINSMQETLSSYDSFDQCAITYAIIKSMQPSYYSDSLTNDESQRLGILEMLAQLGQNMIRDDLENSKRLRRTVADFGFSRGFSGKLEAEHRLGYDRAMDPHGPGRKRTADIYVSKRGLGFGMDRGFSGQQAARHLMGLHVATWPGGPGRRRRSDADEIKRGMGLGMDRAFSGQQAARYMMGADAANRIGKRSDGSASSGEPEE